MSRVFFAIAIWLSPRCVTMRHLFGNTGWVRQRTKVGRPGSILSGAPGHFCQSSIAIGNGGGQRTARPTFLTGTVGRGAPRAPKASEVVLTRKCNGNCFADLHTASYVYA